MHADRFDGAQQLRIAVADPDHLTGVSRGRLGEQHERAPVDVAVRVGDRVAVGVEPRVSEEGVDAVW